MPLVMELCICSSETDDFVDSEQASSAASQALRILSNLLAGNAIQQTVAVEDVIPTVVVLLKGTLNAANGQHVHLLIKVILFLCQEIHAMV